MRKGRKLENSERPTIQTIAALAGVSKGTVSKVLNNRPGIGSETRQRILNIVENQQYHPSSVAQALSFQRTNNIGLIIPHEAGNSLNSFYWSSILTEIAQEAAQSDYNLILFTVKQEGELKDLYSRILQGGKVDGLIIGSELIDKDLMNRLSRSSIPFILIGQNPDFSHHFVDIENSHASRSMTEHMIRRGLKHIAFLSGPLEYFYNRERLSSYRETMKSNGLEPCDASADQFTAPSVLQALKQLTESCPGMDSLFIGGGCDYLYPVLDWWNSLENGRKIVLTVFDDFLYLDYIEPKICAVKQPLKEIARESIHSLLGIIRGDNVPQIKRIFQTTITERELFPAE